MYQQVMLNVVQPPFEGADVYVRVRCATCNRVRLCSLWKERLGTSRKCWYDRPCTEQERLLVPDYVYR